MLLMLARAQKLDRARDVAALAIGI